ncbi:tRNA pseudouridine(38-40) synthase TruA [Geobacter sulfurreducens]|jgi:tRNA pseudouridine38-40 synthase|uniref:tRNA pseudouridine synthase A n=1 Tax=Geobacter sulfurreducens (strain ATCC 51573 / DSM 12127 / PCA) TaxID=243231 RepID=TRUA_GEOSL|nr:tRNA pseudouridine(38-40) synthase TruA [Geobacter sulfurreducens]P60350.1 RecName: Full=tRNA pseudouridine synthase A; AltName: Full=tRNA pseudouridine(38-40) synthase; AltName: Full=tRNA pseudouridylate synthase I; AltName: Full=tRNA-uridine isomerase I [Geobacter sulfurreducens PCA]AAR36269.1 tRNA pseudouridines 38,39,40 synthase [Geobacter sulfurreducens PCA]ADI85632.1 tRNA pseudouridines 38,39,40 synthase [Geobacter sulfurreducens KN400]AJY69145.1 pseudouridine synthase [Geobacter sulfu
MRTIKLILEYDGTNYAGWQLQPNGLSIQEVVEGALARLLKEPVRLRASGRTDAGVHARGMVAAFDTDRSIPLRAFSDGLNALLPPDIAVRSADEALPGFNPRFAATGKHYRYTIHRGERRSPLVRLQSWHVRGALNLAAMREAARHLTGERDFASFRTAGCAARTTIRRVDAVEISDDGEMLTVDVHGSGFLRNMVRIMVGTLVEVGRGKLTPEHVAQMVVCPGVVPAGPTAPPQGLCLQKVRF